MSISNILVPNDLTIYCESISTTGSTQSDNGFNTTYYNTLSTSAITELAYLTIPVSLANCQYNIKIRGNCFTKAGPSIGGGCIFERSYLVTFLASVVNITELTPGGNIMQTNNIYPVPPPNLGPVVSYSSPNIIVGVINAFNVLDITSWYVETTVSGPLV